MGRLRRMNAPVSGNYLRRELRLFAILVAEIIALNILWTPVNLDFAHFAFCDSGANLSVQYLIAHGYRPGRDFAYPYGLLPILLGRIWFFFFGLTPIAYQALLIICECIMAFAIARVAAALQFGRAAITILLAALWIAIQTSYPATAHVAEAMLLCLALAEQSAGRRSRALAFACAAIFAKPSMGYFYSFLLVAIAAHQARRAFSLRHFLTNLMPAAATALVLGAILSFIYGFIDLMHTVIPAAGAGNYRAMHYGFFTGIGSDFWRQPGSSWTHYLFDVSGFWLAATVFLGGAAAIAASRLWKDTGSSNSEATRRSEIVLTCFILHASFVCLFFGNQWSWIYYSYFLVVGVAAASEFGSISRGFVSALCLLSALAWLRITLAVLHVWSIEDPSPLTAKLWARPNQTAEWHQVLNRVHGRSAIVLDSKGAVELLFPQFNPPVSSALDPGLMPPREIARKVAQISSSEMVLVPMGIDTCGGVPNVPEIRAAMIPFEPVFIGHYFELYLRTPAPIR